RDAAQARFSIEHAMDDHPDLVEGEGTPEIEAAVEDVPGLLDGLIEKSAADPDAPFAPEVLRRLVALRKGDRTADEALRAKLKKTGCRVAALEEVIAEEGGDRGGRRPTQADILIDLAGSAELFHVPDGAGFADLDINGHRET